MKAARNSERGYDRPLLRPNAVKVAPRASNPAIFYRLDEFLADHGRLAAACRLSLQSRPYIGGYSDDRFVLIHTALIRSLSRTEEGAGSSFRERYGAVPGAVRRSRFMLVLGFLDNYNVDLSAGGLARGSDPMEVHEDFVVFLLRYPLTTDRSSIPRGALVRFLDEIGHRWM